MWTSCFRFDIYWANKKKIIYNFRCTLEDQKLWRRYYVDQLNMSLISYGMSNYWKKALYDVNKHSEYALYIFVMYSIIYLLISLKIRLFFSSYSNSTCTEKKNIKRKLYNIGNKISMLINFNVIIYEVLIMNIIETPSIWPSSSLRAWYVWLIFSTWWHFCITLCKNKK